MFEVKLGDNFLMSSLLLLARSLWRPREQGANAGQLSLTAAAATVAGFLMPLAEVLTPVDRLETEAAE